MPLKLGSTTVNSFRLGSTAVSKVYAGSSAVWTSATAPGVPTSLSGTVGNTQVVLTWTAPASDGGSAITDYVVQYSSDSGSTWTTFSDGTSSSTGATVTGLTNGTAYVFRVAAVNAVGTGSYTSASDAVTPVTTPGAPTGVTGTAGDEEVLLTWSVPASDGGSAITDYAVQYSSDSGSTWTTFSDGTSTDTSATVTGLTNDTAYTFRVAAVNAVGTGSYSTASAAVTPTVPCTESVLLLHFDGDDEDTSTTDSSAGAKTITFNGDAQISTTQSKFGGSALYLDGDGDYLSVAASSDWDFGTGDFTIEMWVYVPSTAAQRVAISAGGFSGGWTLYVGDSQGISFAANAGSGWNGTASSDNPPTDAWAHVAVVRHSGTLKIYLDGAEVDSVSSTFSGSISSDSDSLTIGVDGTYGYFSGYIDDLRIVKGLAVYQAEFDPPSSQLSACVSVAPASAPGVPTGVSGTAGDTQVSLTWTEPASDGGSAITDYVVQYSSDSGSNWNTFSDGTSSSASATVTGLTNDTAYIFRVAAVNSVGTGPYSADSASVTPTA